MERTNIEVQHINQVLITNTQQIIFEGKNIEHKIQDLVIEVYKGAKIT